MGLGDWVKNALVLPGSDAADWIFNQIGMGDSTNPDVFGDQAAAQAQQDAAERALQMQMAEAQKARDFFQKQSREGVSNIKGYSSQAQSAIGTSGAQALDYLSQGRSEGLGALLRGNQNAVGTALAGFGQARSDLGAITDLQRYAGAADQPINSFDVMGQRQDRLGGLLDKGLYSDFQQDPGYQFRRQQGEDAINRTAAARGGRMGGETLKALSEFNQNLASQEFGNFTQRRLAEAGQLGASDSSFNSLLANQAGRSDQAALQNRADQMQLANLGFGAQGQLSNLAAQGGQAISGLQFAGGQSLADLVTQMSGQQAGTVQSTGSNLANILMGTGQSVANTLIGAGSNNSQLAQSVMGALGGSAQYAGGAQQAAANQKKELAGLIAMIAASDRRAKTNIEEGEPAVEAMLSQIRPYLFDYVSPEHGSGRHLGVMAQDLEKTAIGAEMVTEVDGVKHVDLKKAVSALLGIVAHLHQRIEEQDRVIDEIEFRRVG